MDNKFIVLHTSQIYGSYYVRIFNNAIIVKTFPTFFISTQSSHYNKYMYKPGIHNTWISIDRNKENFVSRPPNHTPETLNMWRSEWKMSHLPVAGLSKPDKPAYCWIPVYAWLKASIPDVPLVTPGDMLVAAMLLLPMFCKPAKPLNELLDVERDPDNEAEKMKQESSILGTQTP